MEGKPGDGIIALLQKASVRPPKVSDVRSVSSPAWRREAPTPRPPAAAAKAAAAPAKTKEELEDGETGADADAAASASAP
eukprot:5950822-Alexandrium_andersonii.AAC.1